MEWLRWTDERVREILERHAEVLDHWRDQTLTKSNRIKNFENWVLVELVHRLREDGIREIKTNGYLERPSYPIEKMKTGLRGTKRKSHSISPDLSFRLLPENWLVNAEIKTQSASQPVIDDVMLVKFHNQNEKNRNCRACFIWVVVAPADQVLQRRVLRSVEKIREKLARTGIKLEPRTCDGRPWLVYCVAAPGVERGAGK